MRKKPTKPARKFHNFHFLSSKSHEVDLKKQKGLFRTRSILPKSKKKSLNPPECIESVLSIIQKSRDRPRNVKKPLQNAYFSVKNAKKAPKTNQRTPNLHFLSLKSRIIDRKIHLKTQIMRPRSKKKSLKPNWMIQICIFYYWKVRRSDKKRKWSIEKPELR